MSVIKKETPKVETIGPKQDIRFFDQDALNKNIFLKMRKNFLETKKVWHDFGMRRFYVMITPHLGSKGYSLHISNYFLIFISIVSVMSVVTVSYIVTQGHQSARNQVRLVIEKDALEQKITQVAATVDSFSEYFTKFRLEVGTVMNTESSMSHISVLDDPMLGIDTSDESTPIEIIKLQKLEKELDVTKERIFTIGTFMKENQRVLREIPSLYPVATRARITSRFGIRRNPFDHRGVERHDGLDLATLPGTPVFAGADGVISKAGIQGGYGNLIEIQHKYGFATRYGHLQSFASQVYPGARVKQGQVIGYVGATGRVTGYHLHYEVISGGTRVDPEPFVMMLR